MKFLLKISMFLFMGIYIMNAQKSFPDSWLGNYKGDLSIYGVDSVRMTKKMCEPIVWLW